MNDSTSPSVGPESVGPESGSTSTTGTLETTEPVAVARRSKVWLGVLALVVVVALLVGATAVLFVRVQQAQDRADEAVALAGRQDDALDARLADLDARLSATEASAGVTGDDVAALRRQASTLRKCVNAALEAWSQSTQAGQPVSIAKC